MENKYKYCLALAFLSWFLYTALTMSHPIQLKNNDPRLAYCIKNTPEDQLHTDLSDGRYAERLMDCYEKVGLKK